MKRTTRLILTVLLAGVSSAYALEKEKTYAELVTIAKNSNTPVPKRVAAIEKLGEISDPTIERDNRVGEALLSLAVNPELTILARIPAIEALGKLQLNAKKELKDKFLPPFTAILKNPKEHSLVRNTVAKVFKDTLDLAGVPDKDAYRALLDIAKNKTEKSALRGAAMEAIGGFGAPEGLEVLVSGLSDPDVREKAAVAIGQLLGRIGGDGAPLPVPAINKLIEMMADKNTQVNLRVTVMNVLAQLIRDGNTQAKQAFAEIVKIVANSPDDKLVKGGIEALGIIGSAEAVEPLKKAYADYMAAKPAPAPAGDGTAPPVPVVNSKDAEIRGAVMVAVASVLDAQNVRKLGIEQKAVHESVLLLIKAVDDDPSAEVLRAAIFSMRSLYPQKFKAEHKEAVDALIFKLKEPTTSEEIKLEIGKTLFYLLEQDFGIDAARWAEWLRNRK